MINIPEYKWYHLILDTLMFPIMWFILGAWLKGNYQEEPQSTHFWNNKKWYKNPMKFPEEQLYLREQLKNQEQDGTAVKFEGNQKETGPENPGVRSHTTLIGGWKNYWVLQPKDHTGIWYVGWWSPEVKGFSFIPLNGKVRLTVGKGYCYFYGLNEKGKVIPIEKVGEGQIGDNSQIPLL